MSEGKKILVAYDGSDDANAAVQKAIDAAKPKGSVTLLYVYWDPAERRSDILMHEVENAEEDQGSRIFRDIEPKLKESGVKYDLREEQYRDIPGGILTIAQKGGFDAIAVGKMGTGGKAMGPVYQKLKLESKIPLMTP
jgi:nucleotide-binding universal stress UspA family protein